ncbi:arylalkylamine N-acetyltransferase [Thecamonas trahens ATCC 50062]|uniref:Arylalkylamine N-acetyltransferase n=1 Tax=Thecamonas trahens ATCC 50062 TaxID=461836 RepID=A0A0L0DP06_THETB|nr:arylalkylamine N-acetyltransferase [Thecamonas trahens ATCC 50062]KNC54042.1 arylalkylamine N-acetyltransferase [Thecamonas trahens ATCC 50062]|eukprot:XP_013754053.1 arylalkylamine N-acetyltransferase [Thecamonas trahens ATCC 50062]
MDSTDTAGCTGASAAGAKVQYALVGENELDAVMALEEVAFPADEAASRDGMAMRLAQAGEYFLGLYESETDELVGYVAATLSAHDVLDHECMSAHVADGHTLCIHSVVVADRLRRQGLAVAMLKEYVARMAAKDNVRSLQLIAKEYLHDLYTKAGFDRVGKSDVVHGADPWFLYKIDA